MSNKKVFNFTATRVVYETSLAASEVAKRIDAHISQVDSPDDLIRRLTEAKTREDVESIVGGVIGPDKQFMYVLPGSRKRFI